MIQDCSTSVGLWDLSPLVGQAANQISEPACDPFCVWQLQAAGREYKNLALLAVV